MKKKFKIDLSAKNHLRQIEAIKHEIKKYIAREERKELPPQFNSWFFDCKIGEDLDSAQTVKISEINPFIDQLIKQNKAEFYLEILARPSAKPSRK
jgi:hypothetical protein